MDRQSNPLYTGELLILLWMFVLRKRFYETHQEKDAAQFIL